jgi:hypothetical protein
MSKFKPGKSGHPQGRPKGATNKIARPLKEQLSDFLKEKIKELPEIWNKLNARDKASFIKDLLPYYLAKLQTIQVGIEFEQMSDDQLNYIIDILLKKDENH